MASANPTVESGMLGNWVTIGGAAINQQCSLDYGSALSDNTQTMRLQVAMG